MQAKNATVMTLTVTNSQFTDTATASPGNDGLQVELFNTANVTVSVTGSTFLRNFSAGIEYLGNDSTGGSFTANNNIIDSDANDINLAGPGHRADGHLRHREQHAAPDYWRARRLDRGDAWHLRERHDPAPRQEREQHDRHQFLVPDSGSQQGSGISVTAGGAGTVTTSITGNAVRQVDNEGLNVTAGESTGAVNLTVTGNNFSVDNGSPNSDFGMLVVAGAIAGDTVTMCAHISGNTDSGNAANGGDGIGLATEGGTPTLNLQGYGGAANNGGQIASFLDGANTDSPTPAFVLAGAGTIKAAPANCAVPP